MPPASPYELNPNKLAFSCHSIGHLAFNESKRESVTETNGPSNG